MESQGRQNSGGGGGTDATGEGEDEEPSSSSNLNKSDGFRSLLEDHQAQIETQDEENNADGVGNKDPEHALEQFRQQWRSELKKVTAMTSKENSRDCSPAAVVHGSPQRPGAKVAADGEKGNAKVDIYEKASRLFQLGIDLERRGVMHDAVRCYRQALLLVPDIEKRMLVASTSAAAGGRTYAMVASQSNDNAHVADGDDITQTAVAAEELIEIFRHRLFITNGGKALCTPSDPKGAEDSALNHVQGNSALHISQVPSEVLMHIFKWVVSSELDLRQLEHLSMVCCGFYIVARDPELWRLACVKEWGVHVGSLDEVYPTWREMYIERPHLWYNGVYISKISYIRHGEESFQDQFYRPWHLVIYYRYLRFFSDGMMLMLTTPEEPATVVPGLKWRHPRFQGVLKGTYRLVGHDCVAGVLTRKNNVDATSSPYSRTRIIKQPNDLLEHVFSLVLNINSIKNRRHTQLTWSNYEVTARYRNGQTCTSKFDLCDQKFPQSYFSRVKSYSSYAEEPL